MRKHLIALFFLVVMIVFPPIFMAAYIAAFPYLLLECDWPAFRDFRSLFLTRASWADWLDGVLHPYRTTRGL